MKKHQLATLLWLVSSVSGQTLVDVRTQTKNVDFSGAASTIPAKSGTALPASCKLGEMFFNTTNSPGQNLYLCAPANTWTMLAGSSSSSGGGSGITVPSSTTVGNVPQYANTTGSALSAGLNVVTSVGTPGSNSNIPTEQSVRSAISAATSNFSNLTAGTNTSATMLIGSGASLAPTGSGIIAATTVPVLQSSSHIAMGDSITYGYLAGSGGSSGSGYAYPALLGADERANIPALNQAIQTSPVTAGNLGISGTEVCDMANLETVKGVVSTSDNNPFYTMMIGTNDANNKTPGTFDPVFNACHQAALAWVATWNKVAANNTNCTDTGTWSAFTGYALVGEFSTAVGSTKSCTVTTFGGPLYVWFYNSDGSPGAFTYQVDSAATVPETTATTPAIASVYTGTGGHTYGWSLIRVTGLAAGSHTVKFAVTAASSSSGVAIAAVGTPAPSPTYGGPHLFVAGVPKQQGDANSTTTAYFDALVRSNVALMAGDGLDITYVPIRSYLCSQVVGGVCENAAGVADMNTLTVDSAGLHPNSVGQNDLKQAFENAEQFVPYVSTSSGSTSGTVNNGTIGQFAYYTAAGTAVGGHTLVASDIPTLSYDASGAAATAQAAGLQKSNNLSDLTSTATARTNLGFTFTGTGSQTVSGTAAGASGDCAKWDANGNVVDAGSPCGSGSGSGSSAWASLTPGTNTAGAFVLGSGASLAASGTGTIAATSVPASGVSGTLSAANLPSPTASTLGGVQSLALASHQWINSISTTGVPALSQPAFSDVSGVATDAQLPSDQCTLAKYTVAFNDSALTGVSSATPAKTLFTLPSTSTRICLIEISGTTSFTGISGLTAATMRLQSSATTPLLYSPNQDIFGTVGPATNNYWTDSGNTADRTASGVVAAFTFTCSSGNCYSSTLTAGSVYITVGTRTMP